MPTYTELTETVGDQVVEAVKQAEERTLSLVSSVNELTSKFLPSVPDVPTVDGLPSASDVVAANSALMEKVLQAQTAFALSVLDSLPSYGETRGHAQEAGCRQVLNPPPAVAGRLGGPPLARPGPAPPPHPRL